MGHEIAATPLQLITAHAALANRGKLVTPRLLIPNDADASQLLALTQDTVREETARWLIEHGFDPSSPGCEFDVLRSQL